QLDRGMAIVDEVARRRHGADHLPGELVGGAARAVGLDMAASGAGPRARLAALDDHHVAELRPCVKEGAGGDYTAPHPGSERQHDEVLDTAARAVPALC